MKWLEMKVPTKIVCIGDSQTAGTVWPPSYPADLGMLLPFTTVINAGINGQSTAQMLARFDSDVISESPEYVVIIGGVNDIAGGGDYTTPLANIHSMCDLAISAGITPIVCTIPPNYNWDGLPDAATKYSRRTSLNRAIRGLSVSHNLHLIDLYGYMQDPANQGKYLPTYTDQTDRIHPNVAGNAFVASMLNAILFQGR